MRIIIPHAKTAPMLTAVRVALEKDGYHPDLLEMDREDSYFKTFAELWRRQETFVNVEHDIIVWPGAIHELINCSEPWCAFGYHSAVGWLVDGLGCVKFSRELMRQYPNFFEIPGDRSWKNLDRYVANNLKDLGVMLHAHAPGVTNLNPGVLPKEELVVPDWVKQIHDA